MDIHRILNCSVQHCYWHLSKIKGLARNETGRKKPTAEQQQAYQWQRPRCPKPTAWREALEKTSLLLRFFHFLLAIGTTHACQGVQKAKLPLLHGSPPKAQHLLDPQLTSLPSRGLQTARSVRESTHTGTTSRHKCRSPDSTVHLRQLLLGWPTMGKKQRHLCSGKKRLL